MFDDLDLLAGTNVLDFGQWRPAPFGTQLLAELGASVVKVERPGGDPMRGFPDLYRAMNQAKRVIELDLENGTDREEALGLVEVSDVVVEGFRPGVADRLGVGAGAVMRRNPSVVYCSVSGFGQDGPLAQVPGHDINYQAWSGVLAARLPEISRSGIPIADLAGGTYAALAICAALSARARTGQGRKIDVSMTDVLVSWAGPVPARASASGDDPGRNYPAYGAFSCRDGYVTLGVLTEEHFWKALCEVIDLADLAGLETADRAKDGARIRDTIAAAIAECDRDALVGELLAAGVPVAPLLTGDEAVSSEHVEARGLTRVDSDGSVCIGHPVRFD